MSRSIPHVRAVIEKTVNGCISIEKGQASTDLYKFQDYAVRVYTHRERSKFDAIVIGKNTLVCDDPLLNVREGFSKYITRVVVSTSRIDFSKYRISEVPDPIVLATIDNTNMDNYEYPYLRSGAESVDIRKMLEALYKMGISSIIVEGGTAILTQFFNNNLVDEFVFKEIPIIAMRSSDMMVKPHFNNSPIIALTLTDVSKVGNTIVSRYCRKNED